jgi:hypothetical protein
MLLGLVSRHVVDNLGQTTSGHTNDQEEFMDSLRFDALTRLVSVERSRRGLLVGAMASSVVGMAALIPGLSQDADAKKKKRRCKKSGSICGSDKECCTKSKLICDVPQGAGNSDTECCGGNGATCGGVDEEGNARPPFCCVGEGGVREFVCSENDENNPNVEGSCIPAPQEP